MSPESLDLFAQLLGGVRLEATDPQLEEKAALVSRVRAELGTAMSAPPPMTTNEIVAAAKALPLDDLEAAIECRQRECGLTDEAGNAELAAIERLRTALSE